MNAYWVTSEVTPQQVFGEVKEETDLKIKIPDSLSLSDLVLEHSLSLQPDTSSGLTLAYRNADTERGSQSHVQNTYRFQSPGKTKTHFLTPCWRT